MAAPNAPAAPTTTPDRPAAPSAPDRSPFSLPGSEPGPERYYNPERLCPAQRQEGTWRSRP